MLSQSYLDDISELSRCYLNFISMLSRSYLNVISMLSQCYLGVISVLSRCYLKIMPTSVFASLPILSPTSSGVRHGLLSLPSPQPCMDVREAVACAVRSPRPAAAAVLFLVLIRLWDDYSLEPLDLWKLRPVSAGLTYLATSLLQQDDPFGFDESVEGGGAAGGPP